MRAVVQRVREASVIVDGEVVGEVRGGSRRPPRRRQRPTPRRTPTSRGEGRATADLRERRWQVRPLAPRRRRRGARRQPVHADRGHAQGKPSELHGAAQPEVAEPLYEGSARRSSARRARRARRLRRADASLPGQRRAGDDRARRIADPLGERCGRCYPWHTTFHRLHEMGAQRPFFLRSHSRRTDERHLHTRTSPSGRDRARGRARLARGRGARGGARVAEPVLRLRRPSERRRPRALRARSRASSTPIAPTSPSTCPRPGPSGRCASRSTSRPRSDGASPFAPIARSKGETVSRGSCDGAGDGAVLLSLAGEPEPLRIPYDAIVRANIIDTA